MWPLVLLGLGISAAVIAVKESGVPVLTPQQRVIFQSALSKSPPLTGEQLKTLAAAYDSKGHKAEATILLKRARIADMSPADKDKIKGAFQKAMGSQDPTAVRAVANAFEKESFIGSAQSLRDYANSLDVALQIASVDAAKKARTEILQQLHGTLENTNPAHLAAAVTELAGSPNMSAQDRASLLGQAASSSPSSGPSSGSSSGGGPVSSAASAGVGALAGAIGGPAGSLLGSQAGAIGNAAQGALGGQVSNLESEATGALGSLV